MGRTINIEVSNPEKFISDIENNRFTQISGDDIWDLGYEIMPHHDYIKPIDFPNCCENHKKITSQLDDWFNSFPNCCENHKALLKKKWFNKDLYTNIPLKTITSLNYTTSFINDSINKENWYKEITDYIDYVIESFGTPSIGGERLFSYLQSWVKNGLNLTENYKWKRSQLLDFLKSKTQTKTKKNTDLNRLNATFQKWVKSLPEIPLFSSIKVFYKGKLPLNLLLYDGEYNRFTGLTKFKSRTQSELVEVLVNHTKKILVQLTSDNIYKSLNISEREKYEIQIISERHKLEQLSLLNGFSKKELKYVKVLKKWLENEKNFITQLNPIFKNKQGQQDFHSFLIQHIFFLGQNLEKLNHLHKNFEEEDFRDYFLPHLTSISTGHIATGETFNKVGKTDILIQDTNGINKFIAECKLWNGKSYLHSAIDQLIGKYVLWRDEKVAIVIFNKKNKSFTNVIRTAKKAMEEHSLFHSFVEEKFKTIFTYQFKNEDDYKKIIILELILFNCYQG